MRSTLEAVATPKADLSEVGYGGKADSRHKTDDGLLSAKSGPWELGLKQTFGVW